MMACHPKVEITSVAAQYFEDTIDGYFPLGVSCADLLRRRGLVSAWLSLAYAPIMYVPGLPPEAPVPLNTSAGRVGLVDQMLARATLSESGAELGGSAKWRWLGAGRTPPAFSPMTRLAEPAFLRGIALLPDGSSHGHQNSTKEIETARVEIPSNEAAQVEGLLNHLGWSAARLWGPLWCEPGIRKLESDGALYRGQRIFRGSPLRISWGRYFLMTSS